MPKKSEAEEQDTLDEVIKAIDAVEVDPDRHVSIQIDRSLREAVRAAKSSNQAASITVTIKVKAEAGRRMAFAANVSAKLPRPPTSGVTLFADESGAVHNSDPKQLRMDLAKTFTNHDEQES